MAATEKERLLECYTPLGKDELLIWNFSGSETVGRLFNYNLRFHSENRQIDLNALVGQPMSVSLVLPGQGLRYFHGYVNSFCLTSSYSDKFAQYEATMVPWLWFLTRTSDCKIFQKKTVPDIIKEVFNDNGFSDFEDTLTGSFREWEYCVQYRETDFNFVSRLMEQEGIYYYFKHEQGKHTLVLSDAPSAHDNYKDYGKVKFRTMSDSSVLTEEHISDWSMIHNVQPGKYAHTDYNFTTPKTPLLNNHDIVKGHAKADYEVYDYPGEFPVKGEGEVYGRERIEEMAAQHETYHGTSDCRGLCAGYTFSLEEYPRDDQCKKYMILSTNLNVTAEAPESGLSEIAGYSSSFTCMDASIQYRPMRATPKPVIQGTQHALVTGPKGEEIYTDEYGRIKVQFYWDRYGKKDQDSSCWIRVAQIWAGKKWGAMYIPRIGQEVVVDFMEGDPDCPIVIGSVYNASQKIHYSLPDEKTKSYIKSNSSKGGDGHNEMRFEDKAGEEQIYMHAERNMDVRIKHDCMERIIRHRHLITGADGDNGKVGDQREMVYVDKHMKVHRNQEEHIGGDMKLLIGGIDGDGNQDIVIKKVKKELIHDDSNLHVKMNRLEKIDMDQSLKVGMNQYEKIGMNHAVNAGMAIHHKAGMTAVYEASLGLTIKSGGSFVTVMPAGVFIKGPIILINSGGTALSGCGSSPQTAKDAKEAKPTEPDMADDSENGQISCPD